MLQSVPISSLCGITSRRHSIHQVYHETQEAAHCLQHSCSNVTQDRRFSKENFEKQKNEICLHEMAIVSETLQSYGSVQEGGHWEISVAEGLAGSFGYSTLYQGISECDGEFIKSLHSISYYMTRFFMHHLFNVAITRSGKLPAW